MRILLANDYIEGGGAETYNRFLKERLEKRKNEVLFSGKRNKKNKKFSWLKNFYKFEMKEKFSNILDNFNPDVVQIHNFLSHISPSVFASVKNKNIPLILKLGDVRLFCPKSDMMYTNMCPCDYGIYLKCISTGCMIKKKNLYGTFPRFMKMVKIKISNYLINKHVDRIIAPSKFTASLARETFDKKIERIPNPIFWRVEEDNLYENEEEKEKILFVGSLYKGKGLEYLISAFPTVEKNIEKPIELDLIGKGKYQTRLKRLAKEKGVFRKTNFRGYLSHDKMKKEYRKASVFVLPSIMQENSPLTIKEAMSQGTPSITTNIGGQKELVKEGETGYLANPKNSKELAQRISKILKNNDLRRKMSENSIEYAKKFSPEKHIDTMENLFENLVC